MAISKELSSFKMYKWFVDNDGFFRRLPSKMQCADENCAVIERFSLERAADYEFALDAEPATRLMLLINGIDRVTRQMGEYLD